jgi:hypothetical protein
MADMRTEKYIGKTGSWSGGRTRKACRFSYGNTRNGPLLAIICNYFLFKV